MVSQQPQSDRETETHRKRQRRDECSDYKSAPREAPAHRQLDGSLEKKRFRNHGRADPQWQPRKAATAVHVDPLRGHAAKPGRQNHQEEDDRKRIRGVAEVDGKTLEKRDLNEKKRETNDAEIG